MINDLNNENLEIPEASRLAAEKLGNELVQQINDWSGKSRGNEILDCVVKCASSINTHRANIEAAPGALNWMSRQLNKAISAINSTFDIGIPLFKVDRTHMSVHAGAKFKDAVNEVRNITHSGNIDEAKIDVDPSLDPEGPRGP